MENKNITYNTKVFWLPTIMKKKEKKKKQLRDNDFYFFFLYSYLQKCYRFLSWNINPVVHPIALVEKKLEMNCVSKINCIK